MAARIFINYRRDDSMGTAGRLHDRLAQVFGRKNIFMDVDTIPAGVDFVEHLNTQVAKCELFLVIIGPHWLDAKDDVGRRRIENPDDFVSIEIAAALARDIRVIPVLVDGAHMPKANDLPEHLRPLVRRHAVELRNSQFGRDAQALAAKIREGLKRGRARPVRWGAGAAGLVAVFLAGWFGLHWSGAPVWIPWTFGTVQPGAAPRGDEDARRIAEAQAAAEAEAKRQAEEAERQRQAALKAEKERADEETKRQAEEAERQRQDSLKSKKSLIERLFGFDTEGEEAERKGQAAPKVEKERTDAAPATSPQNVQAGLDPQSTIFLDTAYGRVVIKLRADLAPKHVERIKTLTREKFYDNVPFHRVIPGFIAQTGDGSRDDGTGVSKYPNLTAEFSNVPFKRGVVGMARASDPNSANSQFFIMLAEVPSLNGKYTVIGEVVSGMAAVDKIKKGSEANKGMVTNPDRIVRMQVAADTK